MAINQRDYLRTVILQNMQQKARIELLLTEYRNDLVLALEEKFEADRILDNFHDYMEAKLITGEPILEEEIQQKAIYEQMIASNEKLRLMYSEIIDVSDERNHELHNISNYHMWMLSKLELASGQFTAPIVMTKTKERMSEITNGYDLIFYSEWVGPFSIPLDSFSHEVQLEYRIHEG